MRFHVMVVVVATLFAPASAVAQSGHDLLQQALVLEQVRGDLPAAMSLYEDILQKHRGDRPLQARALTQLAHAYELLGRREAIETYQKLSVEFADQRQLAILARARLNELRRPGAAEPTFLLLLADAPDVMDWRATEFDLSPDGSSYVMRIQPDRSRLTSEFQQDVSALYVGHRDGRLPRLLWSSPDPRTGPPHLARWSPDGRQIAFVTTPPPEDGPDRTILRVIPASGGSARTIGEPVPGRVVDLRWSRDSRLVWTDAQGVRAIRLDGGSVEMLGKVGRRAMLGGFSPDGRWLAVSQPSPNPINEQDYDVWLMDARNGTLSRVTDRPGVDAFPVWGKEGKLYFVSGQGGSRNVWRVAIDPATGRPQGEPQQVTFYLDAGVGHLQATTSGIAFTLIRQTPTVYIAAEGETLSPVPVVRGSQPIVSPDGSTVYYVRADRGSESESRTRLLSAVSRAGGEPRTLATGVVAPSGSGLPGYDLSPDGRLLAYVAEEANERALYVLGTLGTPPRRLARLEPRGEVNPQFSPDGSRIGYADGNDLFLVDVNGGTPRRIAELANGFEGWSLRWSPDGKQIAIFGNVSAGGNNAVFVIPSDGSGALKQISSADDYKEGLAWDPNGSRLTYHLSLRNSRTVQIPATGGAETLLHDQPGVWDYRGRWAPDLRSYYFEGAESSGRWRMYRLNTWTGIATRFGGENPSLPTWSRDGRYIVWRESPSSSQLWLMENIP